MLTFLAEILVPEVSISSVVCTMALDGLSVLNPRLDIGDDCFQHGMYSLSCGRVATAFVANWCRTHSSLLLIALLFSWHRLPEPIRELRPCRAESP